MTAAGFLLIGGGVLLVYAGLTGDNPVTALQRVITGKGAPATGAGNTATGTVPSGPLKGKPVPVS